MKHYLAILAIFKNESMIIKEWIEHYKWQGVDHIYLIDNDSDDNYLEIIQPYINEKYITLYHLPEKFKQEEHYNTVFNQIKDNVNWLMVCDIDEYWFGIKKPLVNYLNNLPGNINRVKTYWDMFGSSGFEKQPENIRLSFIYRRAEQLRRIHGGFGKCIVKANQTIKLDVHDHFHINYDFTKEKYNWLDTPNEWNTIVDDFDNIKLFHYQVMSKEYYSKIKMSRGDSARLEWDNIRTWDYFNERDFNDVEDRLLYNLVLNNY